MSVQRPKSGSFTERRFFRSSGFFPRSSTASSVWTLTSSNSSSSVSASSSASSVFDVEEKPRQSSPTQFVITSGTEGNLSPTKLKGGITKPGSTTSTAPLRRSPSSYSRQLKPSQSIRARSRFLSSIFPLDAREATPRLQPLSSSQLNSAANLSTSHHTPNLENHYPAKNPIQNLSADSGPSNSTNINPEKYTSNSSTNNNNKKGSPSPIHIKDPSTTSSASVPIPSLPNNDTTEENDTLAKLTRHHPAAVHNVSVYPVHITRTDSVLDEHDRPKTSTGSIVDLSTSDPLNTVEATISTLVPPVPPIPAHLIDHPACQNLTSPSTTVSKTGPLTPVSKTGPSKTITSTEDQGYQKSAEVGTLDDKAQTGKRSRSNTTVVSAVATVARATAAAIRRTRTTNHQHNNSTGSSETTKQHHHSVKSKPYSPTQPRENLEVSGTTQTNHHYNISGNDDLHLTNDAKTVGARHSHQPNPCLDDRVANDRENDTVPKDRVPNDRVANNRVQEQETDLPAKKDRQSKQYETIEKEEKLNKGDDPKSSKENTEKPLLQKPKRSLKNSLSEGRKLRKEQPIPSHSQLQPNEQDFSFLRRPTTQQSSLCHSSSRHSSCHSSSSNSHAQSHSRSASSSSPLHSAYYNYHPLWQSAASDRPVSQSTFASPSSASPITRTSLGTVKKAGSLGNLAYQSATHSRPHSFCQSRPQTSHQTSSPPYQPLYQHSSQHHSRPQSHLFRLPLTTFVPSQEKSKVTSPSSAADAYTNSSLSTSHLPCSSSAAHSRTTSTTTTNSNTSTSNTNSNTKSSSHSTDHTLNFSQSIRGPRPESVSLSSFPFPPLHRSTSSCFILPPQNEYFDSFSHRPLSATGSPPRSESPTESTRGTSVKSFQRPPYTQSRPKSSYLPRTIPLVSPAYREKHFLPQPSQNNPPHSQLSEHTLPRKLDAHYISQDAPSHSRQSSYEDNRNNNLKNTINNNNNHNMKLLSQHKQNPTQHPKILSSQLPSAPKQKLSKQKLGANSPSTASLPHPNSSVKSVSEGEMTTSPKKKTSLLQKMAPQQRPSSSHQQPLQPVSANMAAVSNALHVGNATTPTPPPRLVTDNVLPSTDLTRDSPDTGGAPTPENGVSPRNTRGLSPSTSAIFRGSFAQPPTMDISRSVSPDHRASVAVPRSHSVQPFGQQDGSINRMSSVPGQHRPQSQDSGNRHISSGSVPYIAMSHTQPRLQPNHSSTASSVNSMLKEPDTETPVLSKRRRSWLPGRNRANSRDTPTPDAKLPAWVLSANAPQYNTAYLEQGEKLRELWDENGSVLVYLYPPETGRGPSFRVPARTIRSSLFFRECLDVESHTPTSASSSSLTGGSDSPAEYSLYIPSEMRNHLSPTESTGIELQRLIGIRNMFALLTGQPFVATPSHPSAFAVLCQVGDLLLEFAYTDLEGFSFGPEVDMAFGYFLDHSDFADVRSSREKTIEAMLVSEKMRSRALYNDVFAHWVGKFAAIKMLNSPLIKQISPVTIVNADRAHFELLKRLDVVNDRLEQFNFPSVFAGTANSTSMTELQSVNFKAWKTAFHKMRFFVMSFYKRQYGSWPPKANSKKNRFHESGLNRLVLKQLYSDMCDLYDLLVDRTSLTPRGLGREYDGAAGSGDSNNGAVATEESSDTPIDAQALRRVLNEFDGSSIPTVPPIPFDLPNIPQMSSIDVTYDLLSAKKKQRFDKKIKDNGLMLVLGKSYDYEAAMKDTPFLREFKAFEFKESKGKVSMELREQRYGFWLFMYVVLQTLPWVTEDVPKVRYSQGVEYFLCQPAVGSAPWLGEQMQTATRKKWYKTEDGRRVELSEDAVEFGVEMVYRRSYCWEQAKVWEGLSEPEADPQAAAAAAANPRASLYATGVESMGAVPGAMQSSDGNDVFGPPSTSSEGASPLSSSPHMKPSQSSRNASPSRPRHSARSSANPAHRASILLGIEPLSFDQLPEPPSNNNYRHSRIMTQGNLFPGGSASPLAVSPSPSPGPAGGSVAGSLYGSQRSMSAHNLAQFAPSPPPGSMMDYHMTGSRRSGIYSAYDSRRASVSSFAGYGPAPPPPVIQGATFDDILEETQKEKKKKKGLFF